MEKMNANTNQREGVSRRSVMRGVLISIMGMAGLLTQKVMARPASSRLAASARRRQEPQYVFDEYGRLMQARYPCDGEARVTRFEYK